MKRIMILLLLFMGAGQLYAQVREISTNEFFYNLLPRMTKPIVLDFWAEWCRPCHRYTPIYLSVARIYEKTADFYRVNIDNNEEWINQWQIESIPTTIVVYNKSCAYIRKEGILDNDKLCNIINDAVKKFKFDDEPYF